jgi:hypothetical protein
VFFANFSFEEDGSDELTGIVRYRKRCVHLGKYLLAMFGKFKTNQMHNFQLVYLFYFISPPTCFGELPFSRRNT